MARPLRARASDPRVKSIADEMPDLLAGPVMAACLPPVVVAQHIGGGDSPRVRAP